MVGSAWELNLNREAFLSDHWQRKPLLIRNAISNFVAPLDSDELAGLPTVCSLRNRWGNFC